MWRIRRICELIAKLGSAHVSWSVRVTRTAHEKRRTFLSWYIRSQARERILLGEQTRTDLRGPKANRVVGSERMRFIFHVFAGTDREICKACHTNKKGVCFAGGPYLTHLCVTGDLTSRAYQVWRVRVHNTLVRWEIIIHILSRWLRVKGYEIILKLRVGWHV